MAATSLSSGKLLVESDGDTHRGGEVAVEGFHDDYFMVQVVPSSYIEARVWVRYTDSNNGYRVTLKGNVYRFLNGNKTLLGWTTMSPSPTPPVALLAIPVVDFLIIGEGGRYWSSGQVEP